MFVRNLFTRNKTIFTQLRYRQSSTDRGVKKIEKIRAFSSLNSRLVQLTEYEVGKSEAGKRFQIRGRDRGLLMLDEEMDGESSAPIKIGDVLYMGKEPVGVLLFKSHGLYFGASFADLASGVKVEKDHMVRNCAGKRMCISTDAVGHEEQVIDVLDVCTVSNEDTAKSLQHVFRDQPRDVDREVIVNGWSVGIAALDGITPLGRGQSMLFTTDFDAAGVDRRDKLMFDASIGILKNEFNPNVHVWYSIPPSAKSSSPTENDIPSFYTKDAMLKKVAQHGVEGRTSLVVSDKFASLLPDPDVLGLLTSYVSISLAEMRRDSSENALLILPDLHSHYLVWRRAQRLAVEYYKETKGIVPASSFAPGTDRADLRHFYSTLIQRSSKLNATLGGGSLSVLQGVFAGNQTRLLLADQQVKKAETEEKVYSLRDLMKDSSRSVTELNRLKLLDSRGVKFTASTLKKIGIAPPKVEYETEEEKLLAWGLNGPLVSKETQTQHAEELKSISDGHIVVMPKEELFDFDIRNSLTRIGIGANKMRSKDTRPHALRQVTGPLRLKLSSMLDTVEKTPETIPEEVYTFAEALRHVEEGRMTLEQEVVLIHAVTQGLFDSSNKHLLENGERSMFLQNVVIPDHIQQVVRDNKDVLTDGQLLEVKKIAQGAIEKALMS